MTTRSRAAAIFSLSLILNLVFVLVFVNRNKFPQLNSKQIGDSGYLIAVNLLEGRGYMQYFDDIKYELWRPPTFPLFLAGLFAVAGKSYLNMRLSLCVFGALAAVATFYAARRLWGERVGTIAGVAAAVNPSLIFSSGLSGPESLVALLLMLSFIALLHLRDKPSHRTALVAGVIIGLVALTKTFYLVYALVAAGWLLVQPGPKRALRKSAAVMLAGFALVLAPWAVRNWIVVGSPRIATTDAALVLWGANVPSWLTVDHSQVRWPPEEFFQNFEMLKQMDELKRDRWFVEQAAVSITAHPWEYAQRVVSRIWIMWKPFPYEQSYAGLMPKLRVVVMLTTFVPLLVLFVVGAWKLRRDVRTFSIIYVLLLAVTGSTALAHSTGRYRSPLEPLMIVIAAFAADQLLQSFRARRGSQKASLSSEEGPLAASSGSPAPPTHSSTLLQRA